VNKSVLFRRRFFKERCYWSICKIDRAKRCTSKMCCWMQLYHEL